MRLQQRIETIDAAHPNDGGAYERRCSGVRDRRSLANVQRRYSLPGNELAPWGWADEIEVWVRFVYGMIVWFKGGCK